MNKQKDVFLKPSPARGQRQVKRQVQVVLRELVPQIAGLHLERSGKYYPCCRLSRINLNDVPEQEKR